ncbi:MAG: ketol-acid reductoisomerase [Verrucomicrobia bacterium]|nr:ketol-acid reductoisomerase [Verrucomicrobiota bacterium]
MRHTISVVVQNRFGVLTRIAGLFSGRGFNIDTLNVGPTQNDKVSRMTLVVVGNDQVLEQVVKQLNKLVDVLEVHDFKDGDVIDRELILLRVKATSSTRPEVMQICDIFRAKIVDVQSTSLSIEVTGDESKIDKFLQLMKPFGILELSRTGRIYTDRDASLTPLQRRRVAVIGFGSQGHAHALNLKNSGIKVTIGLYRGSKSIAVAKKHGFKVLPTAEAVRGADVIFVAVPDLKIPSVYEKDIAPNLRKGQCLLFSHGFAIHYKTVRPPKNVDVILVAPKGPGHIVRRQYQEGRGVPALFAVQQNPSGQARAIAMAWARGIGATRAGLLQTTFQEETETDLFGEQAVLCGGTSALIQAGFEVLLKAGYQPEVAYFEVLHELKLIVDLINESGIAGMRFSISETAKYGDVTRGPRVVDARTKRSMEAVLRQIRNGAFAREWIRESRTGMKRYHALLKKGEKHPIEKTGARLRGLMPWIRRRNLKGAQAAY